jgi:uncharacterized protein (TIGR02001 family)
MRLLCGALTAAMWASPAVAAEVSGDLGVVSDYRYRGVTLSRGRPAVQASVTMEHDSGLYAEAWASTLARPGDPTDSEVDVTAGFSKDLSNAVNLDLSGTYFAYPSAGSDNYVEATALVTATHGAASASLSFSYIPSQRATRDDRGAGHDNAYLFATLNFSIPKTLVTLKSGLGYERGAFDEVEHGGKWDWTLGCEAEFKPVRLGLAYVASNADGGDRHALVASAFISW